MGIVKAEIQLANQDDVSDARRGRIKKDEIRRISVESIVDTGSWYMAINETVKAQLGLDSSGNTEPAQLADGSIIELELVGPIEVRFLNRRCVVEAMVLPGDNEILLGAIPMEAMDVLVDPKGQRLILPPTRPNRPQFSLK